MTSIVAGIDGSPAQAAPPGPRPARRCRAPAEIKSEGVAMATPFFLIRAHAPSLDAPPFFVHHPLPVFLGEGTLLWVRQYIQHHL